MVEEGAEGGGLCLDERVGTSKSGDKCLEDPHVAQTNASFIDDSLSLVVAKECLETEERTQLDMDTSVILRDKGLPEH